MTKDREHKLIIWGCLALAVAIIIWLLLQKQQAPAQTSGGTADTPAVQYTQSPLTIPGGNTYVVNPPAQGLPNVYNITVPGQSTPNYAMNGDCSCGCGGGSGGGTTYSFDLFNKQETATFNALQTTADAALTASRQAVLNSFGYNEGVFVNNGTPTPWAG